MSTGARAAQPSETSLRQRIPGHALIERLLLEWDKGTIRMEPDGLVIDDEAIGWYQGVLGERHIASVLEALGQDWFALHSLPISPRRRDVDHVIVGPSGVFTINTKFHPGQRVWAGGFKIYVGSGDNNENRTYVTSAMSEAQEVARIISARLGRRIDVTPVLAFVDPQPFIVRHAVGTDQLPVIVASNITLGGRLSYMPRRFSRDEVAEIASALEDPTTWALAPEPAWNGQALQKEFLSLESRVEPYLRDRRRDSPGASEQEQTGARKESVPVEPPTALRDNLSDRRQRLWLWLDRVDKANRLVGSVALGALVGIAAGVTTFLLMVAGLAS